MADQGNRKERRRQKKLAQKSPDAAFQNAWGLHQAGRLAEAEAAYGKILKGAPDFFEANVNLGVVLQGQGKLEEALDAYKQAIKINPDSPEIHFAFATALQEMEQTVVAVAAYQRAVELKPDFVDALNGLAIALQTQGDAENATKSFERALEADPDNAETLNNLGTLYHKEARLDDAMATYRRALDIRPDYAEAHRNLSHVLLLGGHLAEGWAESRWRWKAKDFPSEKRSFPSPIWNGEDISGKTLLVWGEQGVGDEVHFAAMVPDLIGQGAAIVLECDRRLVALFERSFTQAACVARETPAAAEITSDIDFQIPSGDLGGYLRPDFDSFPDKESYLIADGARTAALKNQYQDGTDDLLVGIAWHSTNPDIGKEKSMSLMDWRPLAGLPGIRFIDLQYGDTSSERAEFEKQTGVAVMHDDGVNQMKDLDAFAAQIAAMDLVISVSNTTVHFAGALGVPTWVMLNTLPLPVWMLDRDDCPWHPSIRLFRQGQKGEWSDVIGRVGEALKILKR
ncbi:MAG: tetratricopeptide repeat protein [Rhodospirillales bacterium]|nr:tetratricopeptide repeat protein [Rhodospirillales bacterium]